MKKVIFIQLCLAGLCGALTACGDDDDDSGSTDDSGSEEDSEIGEIETDSQEIETDSDSGTGEDVVFANISGICNNVNLLSPAPGEEGHWAAGRLAPPAYPFQVTSLGYGLIQQVESAPQEGPFCHLDIEHEIQAYVGTNVVPDASLVPVFSRSVTLEKQAKEGNLRVEVKLDKPLILNEGDFLFVAVEMTGVYPDILCVPMCTLSTTPDANYWSNAAEAPFSWALLSNFGISGDMDVLAKGHPFSD